MLPRWMKPVGEGAKRVRTLEVMSESEKSAVKIGLDVVNVLEPNRHADQALHHARGLPLRFGQAAV
ncbi:hypothetical protein D9M68_975520 [compost metagenome]